MKNEKNELGYQKRLLKVGDIIKLKKGDKIYMDIPNHFIYENSLGDWKNFSNIEVVIGHLSCLRNYDSSWLLEKELLVVKTKMDGGSQGHDAFPDGLHVYCVVISDVSDNMKEWIKVDFYQSGCFSAVIEEGKILITDKAEKQVKTTWKIKNKNYIL